MPSLTFQQDANYSGTVDVTIRESNPDSAPASGLGLFVDGNLGVQEQTLLAFAGLFGSGPGQIPIGATITSATLTLRVTDATTTGVSLSRMLIDWPENSSWNTLVNGVQLDGTEAADTADLVIGSTPIGFQDFDVTASLQAWLSGATTAEEANDANNGWVFTGLGTDPFTFRSSESAGVPVLTVTYTVPGGSPPQIALAGSVSQVEGTSLSPTLFTFTVNRTGDTTGTSSVDYAVTGNGTAAADASDFDASVLPSGTVTFDPGETSRTIVIEVDADSVEEANEEFTVTLSNPGGGAQITGATATGTILNDDSGGGGPTLTATFQQGVDYSGTVDVMIREIMPNSAPASGLGLSVDGDSGAQAQVLLAFEGLFGSGAGQIPIGAIITSATLTLRVTDATTTGVSLSRMLVDWPEQSSWNSLVGGIQLDGIEAADVADFVIADVGTGLPEFDVTASLQAWLSGATTAEQANAANNGWVFTALGTDLLTFRSSESAGVPVLTVTYTVPGGNVPQIALAGSVSQSEGTSPSGTAFVFTVTRSGETDSSVSVNYALTGSGLAQANADDFVGGVFPSGTVTFDVGETSKTIIVDVAADSTDEPNETFSVTLSDATGEGQITGATATGTIVNDDNGGGTGEVLAVRVFDGSTFGPAPGCTDPTDVAYDPETGSLFVCDSEVDESPFRSQRNLFERDDNGGWSGHSMRNFTSEPTGVVVWQDRLYICDDNRKMIFVVDKDNPSVLLPGLSFSTTLLNIADPEDLSVNPNNGNLFILNERNKTIYEVELTANGPQIVDQIVLPSPFTTNSNGAEGLAYDSENDQFFVCAGFSSNIYIVSRSGVITDTIDVLAQFPNDGGYRVFPKGLELAPASDGSGNLSLWVTDYGRDQVADGRLFEIMLDRPAQQSTATAVSAFSVDSLQNESTTQSLFSDTNAFEENSVPQVEFELFDHLRPWHSTDLTYDSLLL